MDFFGGELKIVFFALRYDMNTSRFFTYYYFFSPTRD